MQEEFLINPTIEDIPHLVDITDTEVATQRIIVNGQEQVIKSKVSVLVCSNCGRVLHNFGQHFDYLTIVNTINNNKDELYNLNTYCPSCGKKVSYERDIINLISED